MEHTAVLRGRTGGKCCFTIRPKSYVSFEWLRIFLWRALSQRTCTTCSASCARTLRESSSQELTNKDEHQLDLHFCILFENIVAYTRTLRESTCTYLCCSQRTRISAQYVTYSLYLVHICVLLCSVAPSSQRTRTIGWIFRTTSRSFFHLFILLGLHSVYHVK